MTETLGKRILTIGTKRVAICQQVPVHHIGEATSFCYFEGAPATEKSRPWEPNLAFEYGGKFRLPADWLASILLAPPVIHDTRTVIYPSRTRTVETHLGNRSSPEPQRGPCHSGARIGDLRPQASYATVCPIICDVNKRHFPWLETCRRHYP